MKRKYSVLWETSPMFMFDNEPEGGEGAPVETPPANPAPAAPSFDAGAIARELGHVLQQNQPQQPPTPEQIAQAKKDLRVWEPSDEFISRFGNIETQKAALIEMRDGLFGQAFTAAQRFYQEREQEMVRRMEPMERAYYQQQEAAVMTRLGASVPTLAEPQYKPIVDKVIAHFHTSGQRFNSEADLFKAIAKGVEEVVKVGNPSFVLPVGAATTNQPTTKQPGSLPTSSSGSGGGGGRSAGANTSNLPKAVQLLNG